MILMMGRVQGKCQEKVLIIQENLLNGLKTKEPEFTGFHLF